MRSIEGVVAGLLLICVAAPSHAQSDSTTALLNWTRAHCAPVSETNLTAFDAVLGNARVIGLGEAGHGIHEFLSFRNALLKYLVQHAGITAIAAETGYSESVDVDNYVQGRGELTPPLVGSVFAWSTHTPYAENRALLDWLRAYNTTSSTSNRKVHFYGLDLTGGRAGRFVEARRAIDDALAYVQQVDGAQAGSWQQRFAPFIAHFSSAAHDSLNSSDRDVLTATLQDLLGAFDRRAVAWKARSSATEYEQARQNVIVALQLDENFRAAAAESNPQAQREPAMAHNLQWVLEREGPNGRVLLYQANWHISRGPMMTDGCCTSLGEYLSATLGKNYVAIGSAFAEGQNGDRPEVGSLAQNLGQLTNPQCLLDLRSADRLPWFESMRTLQAGRPDHMRIGSAFDAVLFIHTVHDADKAN